MKDNSTKKQFKYFTIFKYEEEQNYLRQMHKSGWKFTRVSGLGTFHFEKCEPEDVIYQLDYNKEGLEHRDEYIRMFKDCGWEYLQEFAGFTYFRKSAGETDGDEKIFCDEDSRAEMLERVYRGRLIPLFIIFFTCIAPQIYFQLFVFDNPVFGAIFVAISILYLAVIIAFIRQFKELKIGRRK